MEQLQGVQLASSGMPDEGSEIADCGGGETVEAKLSRHSCRLCFSISGLIAG